MKERLISIITATAMTLSAMPFTVSAETTEIPDSTAISIDNSTIKAYGEIDENIAWTLDSNGTLTLSGTGFADPDHYFSTPFCDLADEVTAVVINDGITTLEPYLFKDFSNLKTVSLPDGLLAIYREVFENCVNLTEINIPDSVIYIGAGAFENTTWLKNKQSENPLVIGGNVVIDGKGCKGDVVIPDGITAVGSGAFEWCNEITSVKLPDSLTFIGEYAFYHCELIETLDIPKNVSVIKEYAFSECISLKSIDIPDGVKYIYENTFEGCYSLEKVTLPESLLFIGENAFSSCTSLKVINIPKNTDEIHRCAFYNCSSLEELIIESTDTKIFDSNATISSIKVESDEKNAYTGKISGYKGSTAEKYANAYGITFTEIVTTSEKGDANCDGNVNMADAVLIMQSLANPDKYGVNGTDDTHITAQGEKNGDMDGNGLTNADALEIQKQLLKISVTDTGEQALFPVVKIHTANEMSQYEEMKKNKPVVIRNEYNPLLSSASGIGILFDFYYPNNSVNLSADKGTFKTWDIEKGSGAVESVGKTYTIENEGYIFWTPDKESIFGDEKIIIHITDSKNVNLGEIVITHDENGVFSAVLN